MTSSDEGSREVKAIQLAAEEMSPGIRCSSAKTIGLEAAVSSTELFDTRSVALEAQSRRSM